MSCSDNCVSIPVVVEESQGLFLVSFSSTSLWGTPESEPLLEAILLGPTLETMGYLQQVSYCERQERQTEAIYMFNCGKMLLFHKGDNNKMKLIN